MRRILVTGGGGSIGTALCRRLLLEPDTSVIAVDSCEYNLYRLLEEEGVDCTALLGDVRHEAIVESIFNEYQPHSVYHCAALKHVPMLQVEHNAMEAVRTNILGTFTVANAACRAGVQRVCHVSTDKAVNPISMMGATKTWSERIIKQFSHECPTTEWNIVRFGNVMGSSGSVIPRWEQQIMQGGPLTITHPRMQRWFMTISEAVDLVVAAMNGAHRPDNGAGVFVLDMGEVRPILEVANEVMARMGVIVPIAEIGIRPGEKLVEELVSSNEVVNESGVDGVFRLSGDQAGIDVETHVLRSLLELRRFQDCVRLIKDTVGYSGDDLLCESL